jgi:hypothetical protein
MKQYIRLKSPMADTVAKGLDLDMLWGTVNAWAHLRRHHIPPDVALRILSKSGIRRSSDAEHPADSNEQLSALSRLAHSHTPSKSSRRNTAMTKVIDEAIRLSVTRGNAYAEALLRLYPIPASLIYRILFDAAHRRKCATSMPTVPVASA